MFALVVALGVILLGSLLVFASVRRRRLKLENELNNERQRIRIRNDLHDTLGGRLSRMAINSNLLREKFAKENVGLAEGLEKIRASCEAMTNETRDIAWILNPETDRCDKLNDRLSEICQNEFDNENIKIAIKCGKVPKEVTFTGGQKLEIINLVREAVNNALKHSEGDEVQIEFMVKNKTFLLSVEDNGKGLKERSAGIGLSSIKERAIRLNAKLDFSIPTLGYGTCVTLTMPLEHTYTSL